MTLEGRLGQMAVRGQSNPYIDTYTEVELNSLVMMLEVRNEVLCVHNICLGKQNPNMKRHLHLNVLS